MQSTHNAFDTVMTMVERRLASQADGAIEAATALEVLSSISRAFCRTVASFKLRHVVEMNFH